jgi:two-component system OmpR family response regulator/two-component system response regulator QseB
MKSRMPRALHLGLSRGGKAGEVKQAIPPRAGEAIHAFRALLALDDADLQAQLMQQLLARGWRATEAGDAPALQQALQTQAFDALVLDYAGAAWCEPDMLVRGTSPVERPHLLVCCEPPDLAALLRASLPAQSYALRPVDPAQLGARLQAMVLGAKGNLECALLAGVLVLDAQGRCAFEQGRALALTSREFDLLALLMANAGVLCTRDQILAQLYRWGQDLESNAIDVHVHGLRRKLALTQIETVRGEGYRLLPAD